jgi:hypothetical protein
MSRQLETDSKINLQDNPKSDSPKYLVKVSARIIGICSAGLVLLAREGIGPPYLDSIGKAIFWTGMVLVPLFAFNLDLLVSKLGQVSMVVLSALQLISVFYLFDKLREVNFIILACLCLVQCLIFFLPLMLIRKMNRGIWY